MKTLESIMSADMDDDLPGTDIVLKTSGAAGFIRFFKHGSMNANGEYLHRLTKKGTIMVGWKDIPLDPADLGHITFVGNIQEINALPGKPFVPDHLLHMFAGAGSSLASADLTGLDMSSCINISRLFDGCSCLKVVDMTGLDTGKVFSLKQAFQNCASLEKITGFDRLNFKAVTSFEQTFKWCDALKSMTIKSDIPRPCNVDSMFYECKNLKRVELPGLKRVIGAEWMFSNCMNLEYVDIRNLHFDPSRPPHTYAEGMFWNCNKLKHVVISKEFYEQLEDTTGMGITDMGSIKWEIK